MKGSKRRSAGSLAPAGSAAACIWMRNALAYALKTH